MSPSDQNLEPSDLETIFLESPNAICILRVTEASPGEPTFLYARANRTYCRVFWGGSDANVGRTIPEVCPEYPEAGYDVLRSVVQTGVPRGGDLFVALLGKWFNVQISRVGSQSLLLIHNEVTEKEIYRKDAEESRLRYRQLFEMGAVKLVVSAVTLQVLEANAPAVEFLGRPLDHLKSLRLDQFTNLGAQTLDRALGQAHRPEAILLVDQPLANGRVVPVEVHASRNLFDDEWVYFLIFFDRSASLRPPIGGAEGTTSSSAGGTSLLPLLAAFRDRHGREFPFLDELVVPLVALGRARRLGRGQNFISAGERSTVWGLSSNGVFRSYIIDAKGSEVTLAFHRPGEFLAAYSALVAADRSPFFIEALNDCEVLVVDAKEFGQTMIDDPRWYRVCYRELQRDSARRDQREIVLLTESIRQRYLLFIEQNRDILGLLHNYHIASHLGTTPETISRVRRWASVHRSIS